MIKKPKKLDKSQKRWSAHFSAEDLGIYGPIKAHNLTTMLSSTLPEGASVFDLSRAAKRFARALDKALDAAYADELAEETIHPELIASRNNAWDCQDINELGELMREFSASVEARPYLHADDFFHDFGSLPTAGIPDDVNTSYPIWAMDASENCLTGWSSTDYETETLQQIQRHA